MKTNNWVATNKLTMGDVAVLAWLSALIWNPINE